MESIGPNFRQNHLPQVTVFAEANEEPEIMLSVSEHASNDAKMGVQQADTPVVHALTCDVEAWFHAHNLRIPSPVWPSLPTRLERLIPAILDKLDDVSIKATFFVLGDAAQRHQSLIREIALHGHEVACHGWLHEPLYQLTPEAFRQDVLRCRGYLEDVTGQAIVGYRAPAYSVTPKTAWALSILAELGFAYDSSIYPVVSPHGRYGWNGISRAPHPLPAADGGFSGLWEFPLPIMKFGPRRIPALTGGYLRLYPLAMSRRALNALQADGLPAILNFHPWELDTREGRVAPEARALVDKHGRMTRFGKWLHFQGTARTWPRLEALVAGRRFQRVVDLLNDRRMVASGRQSKTEHSLLPHPIPSLAARPGSDKAEAEAP